MNHAPDPDDLIETHEINVVPFIDVMLVLLIVFMVAAPLATVDAPVNLPPSNAAPADRPDAPVWLTVDAAGALMLGEDPVTPEALPAALDTLTGGDRDARIFLRADQALSYGELTAVMNILRGDGWLKLALVGSETHDQIAAPGPVGVDSDTADGTAVPAP